MEEELHKIRGWASHGTLKQFYSEVSAKIGEEGYKAKLEGDTLTIYKTHREGGFLGIGARKIQDAVLVLVGEGANLEIPEESADEEFVRFLADKLKQH